MAHARRYFKRAGENGPERAEHFLKEGQKLCEIERAIKDHQITGEAKMKYRTEQALPILMELKTWLDDQVQKVAPQIHHWKSRTLHQAALERIDGLLPMRLH